ncbi:MAG TPA: hypothetical protein PKC29_11065 [Thermodesulfobacteriota bacterium]|nr:hypothetical protein [Thermodesulfobacteriota bacterium]
MSEPEAPGSFGSSTIRVKTSLQRIPPSPKAMKRSFRLLHKKPAGPGPRII